MTKGDWLVLALSVLIYSALWLLSKHWQPHFKCPDCGQDSYGSAVVEERYCQHCRKFFEEVRK